MAMVAPIADKFRSRYLSRMFEGISLADVTLISKLGRRRKTTFKNAQSERLDLNTFSRKSRFRRALLLATQIE